MAESAELSILWRGKQDSDASRPPLFGIKMITNTAAALLAHKRLERQLPRKVHAADHTGTADSFIVKNRRGKNGKEIKTYIPTRTMVDWDA